jgi:hypothetical protein
LYSFFCSLHLLNVLLQYYSLKFVSCVAGEEIMNEQGEYDNSAVIYRLCPAEDCSDNSGESCSSGYGTMVTGLNTFLNYYFAMKYGDEENEDSTGNVFQLSDYAQCSAVEIEQEEQMQYNGGRKRALEQGLQFFVGPACSEDGNDIKLEWFSDEDCTKVEEKYTYEALTGGVLPYSDGGVVASDCVSCYENDNGEYGVSDFCMAIYDDSVRCETEMSAVYYVRDEGGCDFIDELMAPKSPWQTVGVVALWILWFLLGFYILILGYFFYKQCSKYNWICF